MALIWRDLRIFLGRSWARNSTQRISSRTFCCDIQWIQNQDIQWNKLTQREMDSISARHFVGHHWTISGPICPGADHLKPRAARLKSLNTRYGTQLLVSRTLRSPDRKTAWNFSTQKSCKSFGCLSCLLHLSVEDFLYLIFISLPSDLLGAETLRGSEALHTTSLGVGELFVARTVGKQRARWLSPTSEVGRCF